MNKLGRATRIGMVCTSIWLLTACSGGGGVGGGGGGGGGTDPSPAPGNPLHGKRKQALPGSVTMYDLKNGAPAQQKSGIVDPSVSAGRRVSPGATQIERDSITITPAPQPGGKVTAQVSPQAGRTLMITGWFGKESEIDSVCESADRFGPYIVELNQDFTVQSITPRWTPFSDTTRELLEQERFSVCFSVEADFDAHVEISHLTFLFDLCTACDDGSVCTDNFCDGTGGGGGDDPPPGCFSTAVDCDDGDPCTMDSCDPDFGCANVNTCGVCGDGIVDPDEFCDDAGESASCDIDCTFAICGDGTLNGSAGENCDDGNTDGGDGCDANCQQEIG